MCWSTTPPSGLSRARSRRSWRRSSSAPSAPAIIDTTSVTAERGSRVDGVAPGPICTPLIPAAFAADEVDKHGGQVPLARPGQPSEAAPCFVFLASADSSYMSGQVLHPNGGEAGSG